MTVHAHVPTRPPDLTAALRAFLGAVGLGLLALLLAYATVLFAREDGRIVSIWPLNAVFVALLMRRRVSEWSLPLMALWLGNGSANLALGDDLVRAAILSSANLVEVAVATRLVVGRYTVRLTRRSGLLRFLRAAIVACGVSTTLTTIALVVRGGAPPVEGASLWFTAHLLSLLVFTPPLAIAFAGGIAPLIQREALPRTLVVSLLASAVTTASFIQSDYPLLFITPVMIVLVAFQLGLAGAVLMTLLFALISIPLTLSGFGPLSLVDGQLAQRVLILEAFLLLMSLTALMVGGAVHERRALLRRLLSARSRAQARAISEGELLDQARLSEKISNVGYWTLVPATGDVFWSDEVYRIHGVTPGSFQPGLDNALGFYVPEDRPMVEALIAEHITSGDGWSFDARLVRRSDGQVRNVRSVATCLRGPGGEVSKIFGVFKDLTEERRLLAELAEKETRYRLLADNATDVIAVYDMNGIFSYLSPSIHDMLGYQPEELIGTRSFDLMPPAEGKRVAAAFAKALPDLEGFTIEYCAHRKDGSVRWLEARPRPQRDADGSIVGFVDNVRDVTERRAREAALAEARVAAEAATRTKAAFLANMSHEIRTPLNGVLGFTELLTDTDLTDAQKHYVDRIRTAATGLSVLVNDILDVSRIEAGKLSVDDRIFDVRAVAEDVMDLIATGPGAGKPIVFTFQCAPEVATRIRGDDARLRQILLNIVGNAAKFTETGSIGLTIAQVGSSLVAQVRDTGPGIPSELIGKLFESFSQADGSITRRFGGSGLGLSISRSLAQLMGGDLTLESVLGVGTTVTLTLPYQPAEPAAADDVTMTSRKAQPSVSETGGSLSVLVVDDVAVNREFVRIALGAQGHRVTEAASGAEALRLLQSGSGFDVVLMDVQMPEMDGLTATRHIRALPQPLGRIPVIGLTANAYPEQIEACRAAGMDDHVAKPVDLKVLTTRLQNVADSRVGRTRPSAPLASTEDPGMAALTDRYRTHLATLPAELDRLAVQPIVDKAKALAVLAHSVAGTAGSLGFTELSRAAFDLEDCARRAMQGDHDPGQLDEPMHNFRVALDTLATTDR